MVEEIQVLKARLREATAAGFRVELISAQTGLSRSWLEKFRASYPCSPSIERVARLKAWLDLNGPSRNRGRRAGRHHLRRATDQVLTPAQVRSEVAEGDA
jgi:hypothetical protein